jgi:hypothetical protein
MTYYFQVTPLLQERRLISPKEVLKAKGIDFTCYMAPNGKGAWVYQYEADNEFVVQELAQTWPDCASMTAEDALVKIDSWKDPISALAEIDLKSIRTIREYVASQPGASKYVTDLEAAAAWERKKL